MNGRTTKKHQKTAAARSKNVKVRAKFGRTDTEYLDTTRMIREERGSPRDPQLSPLAKPEGAAYQGFPVVPETETDGWCYGAITEFLEPDGCEEGDAFVIAPDGTQAGLVWEVGYGGFDEVCAPSPDRWGVYAVGFVRPVKTLDDLIFNFRQILPDLKRKHEAIIR